jgi:hypothetical protein
VEIGEEGDGLLGGCWRAGGKCVAMKRLRERERGGTEAAGGW